MRWTSDILRGLALAGALMTSQVWGAEPLPAARAQGAHAPRQAAPLAPGRSAGVRRAQQVQTRILLLGAAGVAAAVVLAVTAGGGSHGQASPQMQNNSVTTSSATTS